MASGNVGSLEHVLVKTFKEFYEDDDNVDEFSGLSCDRDGSPQDSEESKEGMGCRSAQTSVSEENQTEEAPEGDGGDETIGENSNASNEEDICSRQDEKPEQAEISLEFMLDDPEVQADMAEIQRQLDVKLKKADKLQVILEGALKESKEHDDRVEEDMQKRGLLLGAEYPRNRPLDTLSAVQMKELGINLVVARDLMAINEEKEMYKRGQITRGVGKSIYLRPNTPNYMKPQDWKERKASNQLDENEDNASEFKARGKQKIVPKSAENIVNPEVEKANKELLERMKRRTEFLKNPRFTLTTARNRDWTMSVLNKDQSAPPVFAAETIEALEHSWDVGFLGHCEEANSQDLGVQTPKHPQSLFSFRLEPEFLCFGDYDVNIEKHLTVKIINISTVSRSLRFLPPSSKYFAIKKADYPSKASMIAPGMACNLTVTFCANSLGDCRDYVVACTETEKFKIALIARREPPKLTLHKALQCGSCFIGDCSKTSFAFKNLGGPARFHIVSEQDWNSVDSEISNGDKQALSVGNGVFTISPRVIALQSGDCAFIEVSFQPQEVGEFETNFIMVCDNCQVQLVLLKGSACAVGVKIVQLEEYALDLENPLMLQPQAIPFPDVTIGDETQRQLCLRNPSQIGFDFHWEIDGPAKIFRVCPVKGRLEPMDDVPFTWYFSPVSEGKAFAKAKLFVDHVPLEALPPGLPCLNLCLFGESFVPKFCIEPGTVAIADEVLHVGIPHEFRFILKNESTCDVEFSWSYKRQRGKLASVTLPRRMILGRNEERDVVLEMTPQCSGEILETVLCKASGSSSSSQEVALKGRVKVPFVRLVKTMVDFGLMSVNMQKQVEFKIQHDGATRIRISEAVTLLNFSEEDENANEAIDSHSGGLNEVASIMSSSQPELAQTAVLGLDNINNWIEIVNEGVLSIPIRCFAGEIPERLRKQLLIEVENGEALLLDVQAEIQSPKVHLSLTKLDLGQVYVTVPVKQSLQMVNLSNLEADFEWRLLTSSASENFEISFWPSSGRLSAKETMDVEVILNSLKPGRITALIICEVQGMEAPLGFSLHCLAKGLVVRFSIDEKEWDQSLPKLDFGEEVPLCERRSIKVTVQNDSAIPAQFRLGLKTFEGPCIPKSLQTNSSCDAHRLLLGEKHEITEVYSSETGKAYIRSKLARQEDQKVLSKKEGVAFLCLPKEGVLKPWGKAQFEVVCFNNLPGKYKSELQCQIEGMPLMGSQIKVCVVGSPLQLSLHTVGLVDSTDGPLLRLGQALLNTGPISKVIKIKNFSPIPALVSWTAVGKRPTDADVVETEITPIAGDNAVVEVYIVPHRDLSKPPPFIIEPAEQIAQPNAIVSFRVTYTPRLEMEGLDIAYLVADGDWIQDEKDDDMDSTAARSGMLGFLRLTVSATSMKPSLELDRRNRGLDQKAFLGFATWSTKSLDDPCYFKTVTFTNNGPIKLGCLLSTFGRCFKISQSKVVSSTAMQLSKAELEKLRSISETDEEWKGGLKVALSPGALLVVTVQFKPPYQVNVDADDPNDALRSTFDGLLRLRFHNGDFQEIDLEGTILAPTIVVTPAEFDFGTVHVDDVLTTKLRFSNPTVVPAQWEIVHIPSDPKASRRDAIDDPSCWIFDQIEGQIEGPTLPISSSLAFMPRGFDAGAKRVPPIINVCFSPSQQAIFESLFQVKVESGTSFEVLLRGIGSFEES